MIKTANKSIPFSIKSSDIKKFNAFVGRRARAVQSAGRRALGRGGWKEDRGSRSGNVRKEGKLRGGVNDARVSKLRRSRQQKELLLTNRRTDCFVNSILKLVFSTNLPTYFHANLANLTRSRPNQEFTVSHQLHELSQSQGEQSTCHVRTEVSLRSGMNYLDHNEQEDAADFLIALNTTLKSEMGWEGWEGKSRTEKQFRTGGNGA